MYIQTPKPLEVRGGEQKSSAKAGKGKKAKKEKKKPKRGKKPAGKGKKKPECRKRKGGKDVGGKHGRRKKSRMVEDMAEDGRNSGRVMYVVPCTPPRADSRGMQGHQ